MKISKLAGDAWPENSKYRNEDGPYEDGCRLGRDIGIEICGLDVWIDEVELAKLLWVSDGNTMPWEIELQKRRKSYRVKARLLNENMHKFVRVGRREDAKRD